MIPQIIIYDFGSQYTQLIARRVRELNVYCEIHPFTAFTGLEPGVKGIILSGSPCSVRDAGSPQIDIEEIRGKVPILGICYGAQLLAQKFGGKVQASDHREFGRATLEGVPEGDPLMVGLHVNSQVWMSHGDTIIELPKGAEVVARTKSIPIAAYKFHHEQTWGLQFHPEVTHSAQGTLLFHNFVVNICNCEQSWTPGTFVETTIQTLKDELEGDQVVMALSGGVDSSVAAMLLHRAIGPRLHCIFVDNGLLRKNEYQQVLDSYHAMGLNIKGVDAAQLFYDALAGKSDPEEKRKAIGRTFIEVFDVEAKAIQNVKWLGQGTIYPDIIESVSVKGPSATIKSHHNVGGLPEKMDLKVVEPLNTLFKDEVRLVGRELGIPQAILGRHPFPGPGLGIRILGDITVEKVRLAQEADSIFISKLREYGLYEQVWQAGAMLLPVKSVGVMGDERTYQNTVALRAVTSIDGMTADWAHLPYEFLADVSNTIINKVDGINRVVYDISSKPPATIEWE